MIIPKGALRGLNGQDTRNGSAPNLKRGDMQNKRLIAAAIAIASMLGVAASRTGAVLDRGAPEPAANQRGDYPMVTVRATVETDWLTPAEARRTLERRSTALTNWLSTRGGKVRVLSNTSLLLTHAANGARLATPRARFERILQIQLPLGEIMEPERGVTVAPDSVDLAGTAGPMGVVMNAF